MSTCLNNQKPHLFADLEFGFFFFSNQYIRVRFKQCGVRLRYGPIPYSNLLPCEWTEAVIRLSSNVPPNLPFHSVYLRIICIGMWLGRSLPIHIPTDT